MLTDLAQRFARRSSKRSRSAPASTCRKLKGKHKRLALRVGSDDEVEDAIFGDITPLAMTDTDAPTTPRCSPRRLTTDEPQLDVMRGRKHPRQGSSNNSSDSEPQPKRAKGKEREVNTSYTSPRKCSSLSIHSLSNSDIETRSTTRGVHAQGCRLRLRRRC